MVALRKSSWLRLVVSCSAEMLALLCPVFRRTFRLMLPTSLRQSCPGPVAPVPDAPPVPPPPPPPWVGASWPSDEALHGLWSRLDRRLSAPPRPPAADADTVPPLAPPPGPATCCQPFAANPSTGPALLGPLPPPSPNEPIAYRPIPLLTLNLRTSSRRLLPPPLLCPLPQPLLPPPPSPASSASASASSASPSPSSPSSPSPSCFPPGFVPAFPWPSWPEMK